MRLSHLPDQVSVILFTLLKFHLPQIRSNWSLRKSAAGYNGVTEKQTRAHTCAIFSSVQASPNVTDSSVFGGAADSLEASKDVGYSVGVSLYIFRSF